MTLHDWLNQEGGRASALAAHLKVSKSSISQYRRDGVPPKYWRAVVAFTRRQVTLDDLLAGLERAKATA